MVNAARVSAHVKPIAQAGLISKGLVYCLLGILAFMAAFHMGGQSTNNTDKQGIFSIIYKQTGGQIMLGIIALGLLCYSLWRAIQTFGDTQQKGNNAKGIATRARYLFSGLIYASLAVYAIKMLLSATGGSGKNNQQNMVQEILSKPYGQWLLRLAAVIIAAVGFYQVYYALSKKYRKHIDSADTVNKSLLLSAGKIGYLARGIVWLIISWLFTKAALHSNSSEAGDTSEAFQFLAESILWFLPGGSSWCGSVLLWSF